MGAGLTAPGINTRIVDAVSDMTAQEIAVRFAWTVGLTYAVAVPRAGVEQFVEPSGARVVEFSNALPPVSILCASAQLTRLVHNPHEV